MSQPVTTAFLDKVLTLLAPLFLSVTGGDAEAARQAVQSAIAGYNARTDEELHLAALIVAFGFGALDALSKAVDPDLSLNQMMRLRSNAAALSRAGHRNRAALDKRRGEAASEPAPEPAVAEPTLPDSTETPDLVAFARAVNAARTAAPLTRQQRRAAERAAEKARHQQQEQARRAARAIVPDVAGRAASGNGIRFADGGSPAAPPPGA